jgi:hypothetical protein
MMTTLTWTQMRMANKEKYCSVLHFILIKTKNQNLYKLYNFVRGTCVCLHNYISVMYYWLRVNGKWKL